MAIEKKEIRAVIALATLAVGFGLIDETIRDFVVKNIPLSPFTIGIIILIIGAYLFEIKA